MVRTARGLWCWGGMLCLVAAMVGCQMEGKGHGKKESDENEVKVTLAECPLAVQETLKSASAGGTLKEVVKEMEGGKLIYSADAVIGGKEYEINVGADGKLISKEEEHEEHDKDDEDEGHHGKK